MTSAVRGFHMEMSEGEHVTDVYSELAAHAAASVDQIATAMSRTSAIANSAGMEFETTSAMLTTMIEATQESPETLGTAMKTVVARFTELKENVSDTESEFEDLDYNKVDKALKSIGVSLKDTNG
jgi:TP901 family phage tail tape measure protein